MNLYVLTYIVPAILAIGVIGIACLSVKKVNGIGRILYSYLFLNLLIDLASRTMVILRENNLYAFSFSSLLDLTVYFLVFRSLGLGKRAPAFMTFVGLIYVLAETYYLDMSDYESLQPYSKSLCALIIVTMGIALLLKLMKSDEAYPRRHISLILASITFFSLEMILLLPFNFLINVDSNLTLYLWLLRIAFMSMFYAYITSYIYSNGRNRKRSRYGFL
ncbi:hypothetical protein FUAX_53330 (plasmid) [Fulvitalea axinellae]|uniref:YhhN-like protein n=1 Tax=Fulvitalea axinellae TaxID=1182444 RepID=A0AAU9CV22_9BACT|nr:hypothetical protein FUAX_53330 [Fulvitalea axinellae]